MKKGLICTLFLFSYAICMGQMVKEKNCYVDSIYNDICNLTVSEVRYGCDNKEVIYTKINVQNTTDDYEYILLSNHTLENTEFVKNRRQLDDLIINGFFYKFADSPLYFIYLLNDDNVTSDLYLNGGFIKRIKPHESFCLISDARHETITEFACQFHVVTNEQMLKYPSLRHIYERDTWLFSIPDVFFLPETAISNYLNDFGVIKK